jgi:hypothetical protein
MVSRLGGYFCGPHFYLHNDIHPNRVDVCIICREPFTEERAIRLASCSHTVGADCFRDWVRYYLNICPYWSHTLPRTTSPKSLLDWACNHKWFKNCEELVHMLVANDNGGPKFIAALNALHRDRLSLRDLTPILWRFWIKAIFIATVLVMVALVAIGLMSIFLWTITALPTCSLRPTTFARGFPSPATSSFSRSSAYCLDSWGYWQSRRSLQLSSPYLC